MRAFAVLGVLLFTTVALAACLDSPPPPPQGRFEYRLEVPAGFVTDRRNQTLLGAATLPEAAEFLNANLHLPHDIPVKYILCNQANAYWNPHNGTIEVCHQLGAFLLPQVSGHLALAAQGEHETQEDFDADVMTITLNAVRFVFFHEVGHALIQLYNLPITGREEDVADQFATWMLLRDVRPNVGRLPYNMTAGQGAALSGAVGFVAFARASALSSASRIDWAQTHGFDLQRSFNIACWVYGSDPARFAWMTPVPTQAERLHVPSEREPWCKYEHDRIDYAFTTLLHEHLR